MSHLQDCCHLEGETPIEIRTVLGKIRFNIQRMKAVEIFLTGGSLGDKHLDRKVP